MSDNFVPLNSAFVNKQQLFLISGALILLVLLFFFGKTTRSKENAHSKVQSETSSEEKPLTTHDVLSKAKQHLSPEQLSYITQLENSVVRGDVKEQQIKVYKQLAEFWGDSLRHGELAAYYYGEAAKLENSEKNLNFAARLLLRNLKAEEYPSLQSWMAQRAKELFEKSLSINPGNDSAKVGIGACYMFGNISNNPMQGILIIREIAENNPDNLYAQMMLGLGGIKSGQYDKAVERFLIVVKKQPQNIEAILNLAETYDRMGDKANAIKWYTAADTMIALPEAKKEIHDRIKALQ